MAAVTVDDYIKELLCDVDIDPEYEDYDILDCVVNMHDYITSEINGAVELEHYHTFRQFSGVIDIILPSNTDIDASVTVPVIVNGYYKDLPGKVTTGNRQLEDIYSEIHVINTRYVKPEPTDDFMIVDTMNDLLEMPRELLRPGMKVYVKETKREYRLAGGRRRDRKENNHE